MPRRLPAAVLAALVSASPLVGHAQGATPRRAITPADYYRLKTVSDPQRSPDGAWVAYTVTSPDSARDRNDSDVWMTSWDGSQSVRLTWSNESESSPRWSPDNRWLAFVSGRQEGKGGQVWLLDRRGGEAQRVTQIKGGVSDVMWSPDGKRLALVVEDETDSLARRDTSERKTPKPIVLDRYAFKSDGGGYLGSSRSHIAVFTIDTRKLDTLTRGLDDDGTPSWSPDGTRIAFVRTTLPEPRHPGGDDLYVVEARAGATPRRLTDFDGDDSGRPAWSPDGTTIVFLRGDSAKYSAYNQNRLATVPADGSAPARLVPTTIDRPVRSPAFAADGRSVWVVVVDDRTQQVARVRLADGAVERVLTGKRVTSAFSAPGGAADGVMAVLSATPDRAPEIFAAERGTLRQLSHQNDSLFAALQLGTTEEFASRSPDGTDVHAVLVRPAGAAPDSKLPLVLFIHGGPNGQDELAFNLQRELFAARGFAVLSVNYRGSNGRGAAYQKAIFADWGHKEVIDLLGAVDAAVTRGIADPNRLGVGGWSYGGILTDYTIATTPRFKAAVSGAGSALQLSMYGSDMYVTQYEQELGAPWEKRDLWLKLSYPFFNANRIKTPTLFMGGDKDFNVPVVGGEQMYQALRTLGVPTQLVVYPGMHHSPSAPSHRVDILQRYVSWFDRWLAPDAGARPVVGAAQR
ncbi:WD40-like beta Propeller containing protein [Gemmatirosa kalamazoonensis]|uniref:WD40-like beta Propeller containing protein n=1 Tax=Gemmatirosa kalamazoonensis TaxID=861299 RepID=W0RKS0_9BACT|nr:S9 family peptidase [Gemmatirosa kalamazoonensis]AHG91356.1 WD40-like beta Propeller containing protein [Gemmatirosa kalamazoonensis]